MGGDVDVPLLLGPANDVENPGDLVVDKLLLPTESAQQDLDPPPPLESADDCRDAHVVSPSCGRVQLLPGTFILVFA